MGKDVDDAVRRFAADAQIAGDDDDEEFDPTPTKKKGKVRPFVDWPSFNGFIGLLIVVNALCIGLETDAKSEPAALWFTLELAFVAIFLTELVLRLRAHRWNFFTTIDFHTMSTWSQVFSYLNFWNLLDFIIVSMSILDAAFLPLLGMAGANLRFLQMIRFFRLARLIRLIRLFKIFKELWLVASGLIESLKTLFWVCFLVFLLCYIGGTYVSFSIGKDDEMYNDYYRKTGWDHEIYFKGVLRSAFTIFQVITLDNWSDEIVRHVISVQPPMLLFFVVVIMTGAFGLLNIIIGVVVENTIETAARDLIKEKKAQDRQRQFVINHLRDIFEEADVDGSGTLTLDEVVEAVHKPSVYNKLRMIEFPVDNPENIFKLLDFDDSGELTIDEFITGCVRMKGNAKSKDLLVAQVAMDTLAKHCERFEEEMGTLKSKVGGLTDTVRHITSQGELAFLNSQEYRIRHPTFTSNKMPVSTEGELRQAPWENKDHYQYEQYSNVSSQEYSEHPHWPEGIQRLEDQTSEGGPPSLRRAAAAAGDRPPMMRS